jgi:hypothetical protein
METKLAIVLVLMKVFVLVRVKVQLSVLELGQKSALTMAH